MKSKLLRVLVIGPFLAIAPSALASTWYVNGVSGSDGNSCTSATTACKTIGHAISLASSGDSIVVAAAIYTENLTIGINLSLIGSGASTTIIDGGSTATVLKVSSITARVSLTGLTLRNGLTSYRGGGIYNIGILSINKSILTANTAKGNIAYGGGIFNGGTLTVKDSTVTGNFAQASCGSFCFAVGGGINNYAGARLTVSKSTVSRNSVVLPICQALCGASAGGISNSGVLKINNSTIAGNSVHAQLGKGIGGGIYNAGTLAINNDTIGGNSAGSGAGVINVVGMAATLRNSIIAGNSGGNCYGSVTSEGYNLSSDGTCSFNGPGDLNNTDPMLGPLQYNGGPTQTMALPSGSPAVDAGNPTGCKDSAGHLLTTDQRGMPRPDKEDTGGCDMGAFERQSD